MEHISQDKERIVSLDTYRPRSVQPPLAQIEAYWRALARNGELPRRRDVNPRGMEGALGHALVLERVAPTVARFRVAGQVVSKTMGFEVRGMPLSCLFASRSRQAVANAVVDVFSTPALVELDILAPRRFGKSIGGRLLLMPLFDDQDCVTRAIGGLVTDEPIDGGIQFATANHPVRREGIAIRPSETRILQGGAAPKAGGGLSRSHLRVIEGSLAR